MRARMVAGNWKMFGTRRSVTGLLQSLTASIQSAGAGGPTVVVCPTAIHIPLAADLLRGSAVQLGAQNVHHKAEGAYTGEISAAMLADYGVRYVIVGHSERRQYFAESDALVAEKFIAVQAQDMTPVLCLGETLAQREQGRTEKVVLAQLAAVLEQAGIASFRRAVIAYEPVWAIGTGRTATAEQAQEVHGIIRRHLGSVDPDIASQVPVLYGGSVNTANAAQLFAGADIDGGLVGGASLKADDFASICQSLG